MKRRLTTIAVLIPVLGLLAVVGRAELAVRHGRSWAIPIEGYDPRDLLHGHYLQYRYRFQWSGVDTCGDAEMGGELTTGCCLCLTRVDPDGFDPPIRQTPCSEAEQACDGALRSDTVRPPLRYYVPEESAGELEAALRDRPAALRLRIGPDHAPAIEELLIEGRPWREFLR